MEYSHWLPERGYKKKGWAMEFKFSFCDTKSFVECLKAYVCDGCTVKGQQWRQFMDYCVYYIKALRAQQKITKKLF